MIILIMVKTLFKEFLLTNDITGKDILNNLRLSIVRVHI